jgi:Zn-dependent protease
MFGLPRIADLLLSLPAVLWAISFHEFCHGYMAYRLGDPTAKLQGRLTLNPLSHLDPIGALMLVLVRFGWAKPVPIDTRFFKNPKRDIILVSLAGAGGNILTAAFFGIIVRRLLFMVPMSPRIGTLVYIFVTLMIIINLNLAVFNLLPIPPLDGSKLLYVLLPPSQMKYYYWIERYGFYILLIMLALGLFQGVLGPVVGVLYSIVTI